MVRLRGIMVHDVETSTSGDSRPRRPYTSHASRTAVARSRRAGAWQTLSETHLTYTRLEWRPPHHVLAHHRDAAGISQDPLEPPQACPSDAVAAPRAAHRPGCTAAPLSCMPDMGRPSSRRLCGVSLSCRVLWEHAWRISSDDRNMEKGYAWSRVHAWSSCSDDAACTRPFGQARRARPISQN